jgi:hypothetical protein
MHADLARGDIAHQSGRASSHGKYPALGFPSFLKQGPGRVSRRKRYCADNGGDANHPPRLPSQLRDAGARSCEE